ncbi:uncharacterized protein LOC108103508 [Drosophila eugracilis]|uniref:uncharacterized protein LOC108103508 n=1 Tax=Drosophila eugracilis TaxID=29029 RepID=UPI0007E63C74|nr:uncharacterized protein LOC108103508 [Drosophila eugracilis]
MEMVHTAIGVAGVVALLMVVTSSARQVGGLLLDQSRDPICELVSRGGPVVDQLTAVEGETPLVEGDRMDGACSVVQSFGGKVGAFVGPLLPNLGSCRKSGDSPKEEENDNKDSEPAPAKQETPPEADPPAEDPPEE